MLSNRSNKDTKETRATTRTRIQISLKNKLFHLYIQPVKTVNLENQDPKWSELKVDGKNINHRAYTSITIHNDFLYLYGGYQVQQGIMDEFYRMNLKSLSYQWEKLTYKDNPGPRTRHQMCTYCKFNKIRIIFQLLIFLSIFLKYLKGLLFSFEISKQFGEQVSQEFKNQFIIS